MAGFVAAAATADEGYLALDRGIGPDDDLQVGTEEPYILEIG